MEPAHPLPPVKNATCVLNPEKPQLLALATLLSAAVVELPVYVLKNAY